MRLTIPPELAQLDNIHVAKLQPLLARPSDAGDIPGHVAFVFLCFTNRCGSSYVAHVLGSTQHFNVGREFLNFDTVQRIAARQSLGTLSAYLAFLCRRHARNDILVSKLSATHLMVLEHAGLLADLLPRCRFVVIERSDRLAQAISYVIANHTRQWSSQMAASRPAETLAFDRRLIDEALGGTLRHQAALARFFGTNGIVPYALNYENMLADTPHAIAALCRWLGVTAPPPRLADVVLSQQATQINQAWRQRYLEDAVADSVHDAHTLR